MSLPQRTASPCIASAMRAASRRMTLLYDEMMAPSGLRVTQFNILSELERRASEPPTVSELAEILTMERSALGQTLRTLEGDGFVSLDRDAQDSRRRPVRLTPAGRKAVVRATLRNIAENPALADAFDTGRD